ncbi:MAG: LacI family DNA-binding transcriptional regulator [Actinomycetota bacterium]|nr:LacI family DNA-binding transcriptional regulator [Actinomycetota bacterium]
MEVDQPQVSAPGTGASTAAIENPPGAAPSPEAARTSPLMTDVARAAGVSPMTVSRVLNGHPSVRPETRQKVLEAVERLEYRRNSAARTLATRRSQTIGVVAFDSTFYGQAACVRGVEHAARAAGYFVSIATVKEVNERSLGEASDSLVAQSVDGLVVVTPRASVLEELRERAVGVAMVVAGGSPHSGLPTASADQEAGGRRATRHLLFRGHETVWHVAGPEDWDDSHGRLVGWQSALADAGAIEPRVIRGDWTAASGYQAGLELARHRDVTAVFVANDQMALGVMLALKQSGRRVPEDVSVVGFDDIPEAAFFDPPLTTIRQDFEELGRRSMRLLLQAMETGSVASSAPVIPEFVGRLSTADAGAVANGLR